MAVTEKKPPLKARLLERLQNPVQLRACLTVVVVVVGYVAIYMPLSGDIEQTTTKMAAAKKQLELARDVKHLRGQYKRLQARLPKKTDINEWVEYVLSGSRRFPLKLATLDRDPMREVGPYKAVVLRIELEGAFPDMNAFLTWLETNERLIRVDSVRILPHRSNNGSLVMQVILLGVMG
jgi:Tfp pilus assembly protein PilO